MPSVAPGPAEHDTVRRSLAPGEADAHVQRIREQVKSQFAAVYLTIISVIQASVLGYLFVQADAALPRLQPRGALLLVVSFVVVGLVWHEYVMGTTTFRWVPRLPDAFLPLALGTGEVLMVRSIGAESPAWFFSLAGFGVVAWLALAYQYRAARREPENGLVFEALGPWPRISELLVLAGASLAAVAGVLDGRANAGGGTWPGAALLVLAFPGAYVTRTALYWRRICPRVP